MRLACRSGIGLAVAAALMTNLASLLKHRGCQRSRRCGCSQPLRAPAASPAHRWFAAGWGLAAVAWLVHVAALSMAPISLVQAVPRRRRRHPRGDVAAPLRRRGRARRQWLALLLGAAGLVLLGADRPPLPRQPLRAFRWAAILGFEGGLVLLAVGLALGHRSERLASRRGVLLAVLAGMLFALAGVAIKGLTGAGETSIAVLGPWLLIIVVCGALAQYTAVVALQRGGAIETIGLMGLVANATQISAGVLVFGDPLSATPLGIVLQATAFAMVCSSALLLPSQVAKKPRLELLAAAPQLP